MHIKKTFSMAITAFATQLCMMQCFRLTTVLLLLKHWTAAAKMGLRTVDHIFLGLRRIH